MSILISLGGFPGYGKTTQCKLLEQYYRDKIIILSVPKIFSKDKDLIEYLDIEDIKIIKNNMIKAEINMKKGVLIEKYADEILYKVAEKALKRNNIVVLDGSPRDNYSLRLFDELCRQPGVDLGIIIQLISCASSDDIGLSIIRQKSREEEAGRDICITQLSNKSKIYLTYVQEYLCSYLQKQASYIRYYEVNCDNKVEEVYKQVKDFIEAALKGEPSDEKLGSDSGDEARKDEEAGSRANNH